jgi:hypothetical protein
MKQLLTPIHQKTGSETRVLVKGKQFLLLIRHPPCYTYIQSSPVQVFAMQKAKHVSAKQRPGQTSLDEFLQKDNHFRTSKGTSLTSLVTSHAVFLLEKKSKICLERPSWIVNAPEM